MRTFISIVLILLFSVSIAEARHHRHRHIAHHEKHDANGNTSCRNNTVQRHTAYGINICVDPVYADKFVKFFALLKDKGCIVKDIMCQAYGHIRGSNHLGGGACDVDQTDKNKTSACMYHAGEEIKQAGLYDGCSFRDCGHVEAMRGLGHYGFERHYASRTTRTYAARSHHRTRVASIRTQVPSNMNRFGAGF